MLSSWHILLMSGTLLLKCINVKDRLNRNEDLGGMCEAICQLFSRVTQSQVKIIDQSLHEWAAKSLFMVTRTLFSFLTRYFMHWTHEHVEDNHRSLSSPLSPRTVFSNLALWRHHRIIRLISDVTQTQGTGILRSYLSIVLAYATWHKVDIHY